MLDTAFLRSDVRWLLGTVVDAFADIGAPLLPGQRGHFASRRPRSG